MLGLAETAETSDARSSALLDVEKILGEIFPVVLAHAQSLHDDICKRVLALTYFFNALQYHLVCVELHS